VRADGGAERGSGSCRRLCVSDCCRRDGCVKAVKAAGKLKSSKKSKRRMTLLEGACECGAEQNQPKGVSGRGFIEVLSRPIFARRRS